MDRQQTHDQQTQGDAEYTNALVGRLVEHYLARTPLPDKAGKPITITLFHHLYRHVMEEGYGQ